MVSAQTPPSLPTSEAARSILASKLRSPTRPAATQTHPGPGVATVHAPTEVLPPDASPSMEPTTPVAAPIATNTVDAGSDGQSAPSTSANQGTPQPPLPHYDPPLVLSSSEIRQHRFEKPRKRIVSPRSLERFQSSQSFSEIMGLVVALNDCVQGKKISDAAASKCDRSPVVKSIVEVLDRVDKLVDETPPAENASSRFGNPAFRDLYGKIKAESRSLHESIIGLSQIKGAAADTDAIDEIATYFEEAWGNEERIDYGSGMELNFLCWLLCLVKLSVLSIKGDGQAIVLAIFWRYILVMRHIQSLYWLEPAGSHGVWGLDDYHFLPFVFGSGQLVPHRHLRPKSIHDPEVTLEFGHEYMYLACIKFINDIKTASLRWHSPMLDDISSVKTWSKVNSGMLKMYKAEVLSKLPIAQHIFFGSLLPFGKDESSSADEEEEESSAQTAACGHVAHGASGHVHSAGEGQAAGWGDCCGIPIPSAFAAAQDEKEKSKNASGVATGMGSGVRRVPFD